MSFIPNTAIFFVSFQPFSAGVQWFERRHIFIRSFFNVYILCIYIFIFLFFSRSLIESERNLLWRGLRTTAAGRKYAVLARLHPVEHVHHWQPFELLQMIAWPARRWIAAATHNYIIMIQRRYHTIIIYKWDRLRTKRLSIILI